MSQAADVEKQAFFPRFFKAGPGEYAEGDQFLGITVPQVRSIAKQFGPPLSYGDIAELLHDPVHEYRLLALLILMYRYPKASLKEKEKMVKFYLTHRKFVNNWDLVDGSASRILGMYLLETVRDISLLETYARSKNLWEKRIAIIATLAFIADDQFDPTLKITEILLHDSHDLIHKACGWMLREVGKRNQKVEEKFLRTYCKTMPRTMLRYAIEKFDPALRQKYLKGEF